MEPTPEDLALAAEGALRILDAARFLGVGRSTIYSLIRAGRLRTSRIGGRTVVIKASAIRLLAEGLQP